MVVLGYQCKQVKKACVFLNTYRWTVKLDVTQIPSNLLEHQEVKSFTFRKKSELKKEWWQKQTKGHIFKGFNTDCYCRSLDLSPKLK